jgi:hypothetical protein
MKLFFKLLWSGLGAGFLAPAVLAGPASGDTAPQTLRFSFEMNHPLVYFVDSTVKTLTDRTMQLDTGSKSTQTKNSVETRYKIQLTPVRQSKDGTWTLHYQPMDFEQDLDVDGSSGHFVTTLRGLEVKSAQNGIVVVDTAKEIGVTQARAIKQGAYQKMLSGYLDFKPTGEISKVDGDLPFIDFWTDAIKYQVGFFDVAFPPEPVPAGGNWTVNLTLKDLQGLKLGDEGLLETNVFVRNNGPSATNHLQSIGASMTVNVRDIMGSTDAGGQNSMLNIPQFNQVKTGTFEFDPDAGCVVKGAEDESVKTTLDVLVQGHTVTVTMDLQTNTKFELLKN